MAQSMVHSNIMGRVLTNIFPIRCSCTLRLKDDLPLSEMLPTTSSGKLFQTGTAVWIKVLSVDTVLETGTVSRHSSAMTG